MKNSIFKLFAFVTVTFLSAVTNANGQDSTAVAKDSTAAQKEHWQSISGPAENVAYLEECSLATSNSSKKWCTEVSIQRMILQNYSFPAVKDSSSFENREIYWLEFSVSPKGKCHDVKVTGGTNPIISKGIEASFLKANKPFVAGTSNGGTPGFSSYKVKVRAFDLMTPSKDIQMVTSKDPEEDEHRTYILDRQQGVLEN